MQSSQEQQLGNDAANGLDRAQNRCILCSAISAVGLVIISLVGFE